MRTGYVFLLILAVCWAVLYLAGSLTAASFYITAWEPSARTFIAFFMCASLLLALFAALDLEKADDEQPNT